MTFRNKLAETVKGSNDNKILITHGTDAMIESAKYLMTSLGKEDNKVIIFTGAFKLETFKNSDADFNIGVAVGGLQCLCKPGIYIAMNGAIFPCDNGRRNPETGQFISI